MRWLLVAVAACSSSPEPTPQDTTPPEAKPPRIVGVKVVQPTEAGTKNISITPTSDGNKLLVAMIFDDGRVQRVSANGFGGMGPFTQAVSSGSASDACPTLEIWMSNGQTIPAGIDNIEITFESGPSATVPFTVYVVEMFAGYWTNATNFVRSDPSIAAALPIDVGAGDLVVSGLVSCSPITGIAAGSPFASFGAQAHGDLAFAIAESAGQYAGSWEFAGGPFNTTTTSFRPIQ